MSTIDEIAPESASTIPAADARRAARNVTALIIASLLSKGVLFGWQLVLAPWLGATGYGIFSTVSALLVIGASVSSFGMSMIVIRDVAREPRKIGHYWTVVLFIQTVLAVLAYAGINLAAAASGYSEAIRAYTAIAGISIFVDLMGNIGHDLLIAQEKMFKTAAVDVGHVVIRVSLAALMLMLGWGLLGLYAVTILSGVGRAAVLWFLNWRDGVRPEWPFDRELARLLLINSAPLALSAFLSLLYQHADKLMTTAIIGETSTGYLGPAFVINFGVIEVFSTTILVATYPMMSRYYSVDKGEMFGFMVEKLALFMLLFSLPMALVLSIFASDIIVFLFGVKFSPTAGILSILIWYTAITMFGNVFSQGLMVQNRQRMLLVIRASGLGLNITVNAILLSQFRDPRGAALASVIAETLIVTLFITRFRASGWQWQRALRGILRLAGITLGAALVMVLLRQVHVILGMAVGLLLYGGGVLWGRVLAAEDWDLLYRLLAAMPGGSLVQRYWKRQVEINW